MEYKIQDVIHRRVSLVVQVIDDFTNEVIQSPQLIVSAESIPKPIRKPEGFYVFTNIRESRVFLKVSAARYHPQRMEVDLERISKKEYPMVKIRVKPNRLYGLQNKTTSLEGVAPLGSEIKILCKTHPGLKKMLYDYEKGKDEIYIYNPKQEELDGKHFYVSGRSKKDEMEFTIIETVDQENGIYRMEKPLEKSLKKIGTKLIPVSSCMTDADGNYYLLLKEIGEEVEVVCTTVGGKVTRKEAKLELEKCNRLNFE